MSRQAEKRFAAANLKDIKMRAYGAGSIRHPEPVKKRARVQRSAPAPLVISGKRTTLGDLFDISLARMDALREGLDG